ncbi:hypothetical protein ALC56_07665, partial [Trachymyrmex septentrionalis]
VSSVSRSIHQIYSVFSPLHQGEEQPDTDRVSLRPDEVDCKVHEMLAFQEWI